jgi:hypothetical protein
MTALDQYIRLEAIGLWQETPETPEREVVVSFGNASLVLSDTSDRPLAHWSLVGIRPLRVDPDGATVYSTTLDGYETLAIRDAEMVRAIAAVSAAERFAPRPAPRRRGRWIAAGSWCWPSPGSPGSGRRRSGGRRRACCRRNGSSASATRCCCR